MTAPDLTIRNGVVVTPTGLVRGGLTVTTSTQNPHTMQRSSSISKRTGNFSIASASYSPASM